MRWSKEHMVLQPLIHWEPAWICYLGLLRVSLRQKLQNGLSINFLLQNNFKHNKYKKEECHTPYISSFGISNYKTNLLVPQVVLDWRLCNIKVVTNWVHRKIFLTCIRLSLLAMFSPVVSEPSEPPVGINPANILVWMSSLQNHERIIFCFNSWKP